MLRLKAVNMYNMLPYDICITCTVKPGMRDNLMKTPLANEEMWQLSAAPNEREGCMQETQHTFSQLTITRTALKQDIVTKLL